jgi:hypothetical protein
VNPFVVHKSDNADGSTTIAFTGLVFAIHSAGTAYVDSGRDLIVFANGEVEPVSSSGPSADLCERSPPRSGRSHSSGRPDRAAAHHG